MGLNQRVDYNVIKIETLQCPLSFSAPKPKDALPSCRGAPVIQAAPDSSRREAKGSVMNAVNRMAAEGTHSRALQTLPGPRDAQLNCLQALGGEGDAASRRFYHSD